MLKKVFLQTQFADPHPWTEQYLDNFKRLEPFGWYLKVFTPNKLPSSKNIEIVPMTLPEFDRLVSIHCGVDPKNFFLPSGMPSKMLSDFYPAYGQIFQDYIKGFDFHGFTNWDCVYGRLDHFMPDALLEASDIATDDVNAINGIFTLMRNNDAINNLFRKVPFWKEQFQNHEPQAFDEIQFTVAVRIAAAESGLRFTYPPYFGYHSYDRLTPHCPEPNIYFEPDGALIERFEDPAAGMNRFLNPKGCFGREILLFHFNRTKAWPKCLTRRSLLSVPPKPLPVLGVGPVGPMEPVQ